MTWAGVAIVTTAGVGAVNAQQQRKAQQRANEQSANISAAQTQYSPWTGINPQAANIQPVTGNALGGAIQGGLSGAMFAKQLGAGKADPDFADKNFEDSVQLDKAEPMSPTSAPMSPPAYTPMMSEMDRENELSQYSGQQYLPQKNKLRR